MSAPNQTNKLPRTWAGHALAVGFAGLILLGACTSGRTASEDATPLADPAVSDSPSSPSPDEQHALIDTSWLVSVVVVDGQEITPGPTIVPVTMSFSNNAVGGNEGCNSMYEGKWTLLEGDDFEVEGLGVPEGDAECEPWREFLEVLAQADRWSISDDVLTLSTDAGAFLEATKTG